MARILIADEDTSFARALGSELCARGWSVENTEGRERVLALLESKYYDVAVIGWKVTDGRGPELLRQLRAKGIGVAVVALADRAGVEEAVQVIKAGAQEFIGKPVDPGWLSRLLAELCERRCPSSHVLAHRLDLFIRENCSSRELGLRQLCDRFRISPRYAGKLLEKHLGSSFRQRLRYFRVQMAKRLIEATDLPLYAVAEQCGFGNPSRLSAAFHRQEGLRPRRYRTMTRG